VRTADSGGVASSSANYSVPSQSIDSGGAPAQSANYSIYASAIGEFGTGGSASIASTNYGDYIGYIGQLSGLEGPIAAVSRKTQGAGIFDIGLPFSGRVGVECRLGGPSGDHNLVVTLAEPITVGSASVTSGTGSVPSGGTSASGNQVTVNLTGVANVQYLTVLLNNVADSENNAVNVSVTMGMLLGDVTGNGIVSNGDVSLIQGQVAQTVTSSNFREDVNANGILSNGDVSLTQAKVGQTLSPLP
jgi:hypothetical protein